MAYRPTFGAWAKDPGQQLKPRPGQQPAAPAPEIAPLTAADLNQRVDHYAGAPAVPMPEPAPAEARKFLEGGGFSGSSRAAQTAELPSKPPLSPPQSQPPFQPTRVEQRPVGGLKLRGGGGSGGGGGGGRAQFGIGKLRLKGVKEIQQAAEQLHAW